MRRLWRDRRRRATVPMAMIRTTMSTIRPQGVVFDDVVAVGVVVVVAGAVVVVGAGLLVVVAGGLVVVVAGADVVVVVVGCSVVVVVATVVVVVTSAMRTPRPGTAPASWLTAKPRVPATTTVASNVAAASPLEGMARPG
jgi:hypothetical protein